jgi:hypothetical protein
VCALRTADVVFELLRAQLLTSTSSVLVGRTCAINDACVRIVGTPDMCGNVLALHDLFFPLRARSALFIPSAGV